MQRRFAALLAVAGLAAAGCQQQLALGGVLATGEPQVTSIAVDDGFVYWTRADGTVKKVSLDTGLVSTVGARAGAPGNLVLDDANLYWSVDDALVQVPKAGGALQVHPVTATINALALDDVNLYFTASDNTVNKAAKADFAIVPLATSDDPKPVMAGPASVYWGADDPQGALLQVPVAGGTVDALLPQGGAGGVQSLAQDTAHLYWGTADNVPLSAAGTGGDFCSAAIAEGTGPNGTINRMDPDTSNPQVLATGQSTPTSMLSDSAHLYWANANGQVQAVSIGGGDPQPLVQGPSAAECTVSLAMDATNLYFANFCDDAIITMPRL